MFDPLFIISLIGTCVHAFKETYEEEIPAENWANKQLYHEDIMKGVSEEQRMKNLKNGKYKLKNGQSGEIKNNGIPLVKVFDYQK